MSLQVPWIGRPEMYFNSRMLGRRDQISVCFFFLLLAWLLLRKATRGKPGDYLLSGQLMS
jgi:hypothetical protein